MDTTHPDSTPRWLAWLAGLLPSTGGQAGRAGQRASTATFTTYPSRHPPEAIRRLLAASDGARPAGPAETDKGFRATLVCPGAATIEFVSAAPRRDYAGDDEGSSGHTQRQSTGCAGPGPWSSSRQQLTLRLCSDDFIDGGHSLYHGSDPGMSYILVFDALPGLPGCSGLATYAVQEGEAVIDWNRDTDSSSGAYTFTVLVEATPANWGIGPQRDHLLEVIGDFSD